MVLDLGPSSSVCAPWYGCASRTGSETESMARIWTIGHGTRQLDELLDLLQENGIATLVDVRSFPGSRRHPQFGKEALAEAVTAQGLTYVHIPELGGRRREQPGSRHTAIRVAAFRAYADHMDTDDFRAGLAQLEELAHAAPTAYMCSETLWWRCHRRMISDRLTADGWEVIHILGPGKTEPHRLWDVARVEDGRLVYDAGTLPLNETVENGDVRSS